MISCLVFNSGSVGRKECLAIHLRVRYKRFQKAEDPRTKEDYLESPQNEIPVFLDSFKPCLQTI